MNQSEKNYLKRILERVREVYGKTVFIEAYEHISGCYGYYLGIKEMVNNEKFSSILEDEIDKGFQYAKQLNYK